MDTELFCHEPRNFKCHLHVFALHHVMILLLHGTPDVNVATDSDASPSLTFSFMMRFVLCTFTETIIEECSL